MVTVPRPETDFFIQVQSNGADKRFPLLCAVIIWYSFLCSRSLRQFFFFFFRLL